MQQGNDCTDKDVHEIKMAAQSNAVIATASKNIL